MSLVVVVLEDDFERPRWRVAYAVALVFALEFLVSFPFFVSFSLDFLSGSVDGDPAVSAAIDGVVFGTEESSALFAGSGEGFGFGVAGEFAEAVGAEGEVFFFVCIHQFCGSEFFIIAEYVFDRLDGLAVESLPCILKVVAFDVFVDGC